MPHARPHITSKTVGPPPQERAVGRIDRDQPTVLKPAQGHTTRGVVDEFSIHTIDQYLAIHKRCVPPFAVTQMHTHRRRERAIGKLFPRLVGRQPRRGQRPTHQHAEHHPRCATHLGRLRRAWIHNRTRDIRDEIASRQTHRASEHTPGNERHVAGQHRVIQQSAETRPRRHQLDGK